MFSKNEKLMLRQQKRDQLLHSLNNGPNLEPPALGHLKTADYVRCGHISQEL